MSVNLPLGASCYVVDNAEFSHELRPFPVAESKIQRAKPESKNTIFAHKMTAIKSLDNSEFANILHTDLLKNTNKTPHAAPLPREELNTLPLVARAYLP
jgi:hypothetical protein